MKTKQLQYNERELPPYLGYGILDKSSIQFENGVLNASYVFESDNSLVHLVSWSEIRCTLETFCSGNRVRITSYSTLKQALLADFMTWTLDDDECFRFTAREVSKLGNIYVSFPKLDDKNTSVNYFPAGKLFLFSLPLLNKSSPYVDFLDKIKGHQKISFLRERRGMMFSTNSTSHITAHPLVIADFVVPLAYLVSAAKTILEAGVIQEEKRHRLIINEANSSERSLIHTFIGDEHYPYFAICFKEVDNENSETLLEMFELQIQALSKTQNF